MDMKEEIIRRLQVAFEDAEIQLADVTGGGDHWKRVSFQQRSRALTRNWQRSVYAALGE